jgi:SAM-dependent methyltransferase
MKKSGYINHYLKIKKTYPSVLALKLFLGNNPGFNLKNEKPNVSTIIDIGFGDGRDIELFLELGFSVSGVEPDFDVVEHTLKKYHKFKDRLDLRVGSNMNTGYENDTFDIIYASASIYYLPSLKYNINDAFSEAYKICKPGGLLMGTLARNDIHTISEAEKVNRNVYILKDPFYGYRKGQVYHTYSDKSQIINDLVKVGFKDTIIYDYDVNWFGTRETLFIFVTKKPDK